MINDLLQFPLGPQRIVCMTEETTEWLYLLGQEHRIVGISGYTVRPRRAREEKPRVSAFTSAKIDKILDLQPDCVLGFSDMQADIAAELVRRGVQVTIYNQRSVAEIFSMLYQVAAMVGQGEQGLQRIAGMQQSLQAIEDAVAVRLAAGARRPKVFFEEWDTPHISAIRWVSELIGIAGGFAVAGLEPHHCRWIDHRAARAGHHSGLLVRQEVPARDRGRARRLGGRTRSAHQPAV